MLIHFEDWYRSLLLVSSLHQRLNAFLTSLATIFGARKLQAPAIAKQFHTIEKLFQAFVTVIRSLLKFDRDYLSLLLRTEHDKVPPLFLDYLHGESGVVVVDDHQQQ